MRPASELPTTSRKRQTAAQLARLTRESYRGGRRSLVAVDSLDRGSGDIRTYALTGKGSLASSTWRLPAAARAGARGPRIRLSGDFDGDHRTDVAVVEDRPNGNGAVLVARSTGTGFAAPRRWGVTPRAAAGPTSIVTGDFDGDGHMDLAVARGSTSRSSYGITVLLSTGRRFRPPVSWATRLPWDGRYVELEPGDFNADGRTDLVAFVGDDAKAAVKVPVLLSNGKRFTASGGSWYDGILPTKDLADIRPVAGDFDGDGRTDVMVFTPEFFTGNLEALLLRSDGKRLTRAQSQWWTSGLALGRTRMSVGDFDGNGRSDVACLVDGGSTRVDVKLLLASGPGLKPRAGVGVPGLSFSRAGLLDVTG